MTITVSNNIRALNARDGRADPAAPNPHYHLPGKKLTIDDVVTGSMINGNAIWYHCADDGCYYWSGGFAEQAFALGDKKLHDFGEPEQLRILTSLINALRGQLREQVYQYKGLGIGDKNEVSAMGLALNVYVVAKTENEANALVPEYIDYCGIRVPTDVKELGKDSHHSHWDDKPYIMGGTINRQGQKPGTRTLKVANAAGVPHILTCHHVLFPNLPLNSHVYRPDDGVITACFPYPNDPGEVISCTVTHAAFNSEFDYAVARLSPQQAQAIENKVGTARSEIKKYYTLDEQIQSKGLRLTMYGRVTGSAQGKIKDPYANVQIGGVGFESIELIISERISDHGDSGAPVTDANGKLVGYIIGGSDEKDCSYIMPFHKLAETLEYTII